MPPTKRQLALKSRKEQQHQQEKEVRKIDYHRTNHQEVIELISDDQVNNDNNNDIDVVEDNNPLASDDNNDNGNSKTKKIRNTFPSKNQKNLHRKIMDANHENTKNKSKKYKLDHNSNEDHGDEDILVSAELFFNSQKKNHATSNSMANKKTGRPPPHIKTVAPTLDHDHSDNNTTTDESIINDLMDGEDSSTLLTKQASKKRRIVQSFDEDDQEHNSVRNEDNVNSNHDDDHDDSSKNAIGDDDSDIISGPSILKDHQQQQLKMNVDTVDEDNQTTTIEEVADSQVEEDIITEENVETSTIDYVNDDQEEEELNVDDKENEEETVRIQVEKQKMLEKFNREVNERIKKLKSQMKFSVSAFEVMAKKSVKSLPKSVLKMSVKEFLQMKNHQTKKSSRKEKQDSDQETHELDEEKDEWETASTMTNQYENRPTSKSNDQRRNTRGGSSTNKSSVTSTGNKKSVNNSSNKNKKNRVCLIEEEQDEIHDHVPVIHSAPLRRSNRNNITNGASNNSLTKNKIRSGPPPVKSLSKLNAKNGRYATGVKKPATPAFNRRLPDTPQVYGGRYRHQEPDVEGLEEEAEEDYLENQENNYYDQEAVPQPSSLRTRRGYYPQDTPSSHNHRKQQQQKKLAGGVKRSTLTSNGKIMNNNDKYNSSSSTEFEKRLSMKKPRRITLRSRKSDIHETIMSVEGETQTIEPGRSTMTLALDEETILDLDFESAAHEAIGALETSVRSKVFDKFLALRDQLDAFLENF